MVVGSVGDGPPELAVAERVQDVARLEAGPPRLLDAVAHRPQLGDAVRVGADDDAAAELARQHQVAVPEVEAVGRGAELNGDDERGGAGKDRL